VSRAAGPGERGALHAGKRVPRSRVRPRRRGDPPRGQPPPGAPALPITTDDAYTRGVVALDALVAVLQARNDVRLAYVFGSVATGRMHGTSDLDVAVLFAATPAPLTLDRLTEDLEGAARCPVDLVDLAVAPPLLAHEVIATGRCIVCRDATERGEFEARTVLRYLDTAHLRRIQDHYLRERAEARRGRSG